MSVTMLCAGGEILRSKEHSVASVYFKYNGMKIPKDPTD